MSKITKIGFILLISLSVSALADEGNCASIYQKDNQKLTVEVCTAEAENGIARSQNILGVIYQYGWGIPQDYAKAKKWYELSAAQANSTAQFNLAFMYEVGVGMPIDYEKAREWYKKSCDNGDNEACEAYQNLM